MRPEMIWRVAWRDLLSTIRDYRALAATIFMPLILIPLFTLGLPLLMGNLIGGQATERQKVGVVGILPDKLQEFLANDTENKKPSSQISKKEGLELVPVEDPKKAVESGKVEAVLYAKKRLPDKAGHNSVELEVYAKMTSLRVSTGVYQKINTAISEYNRYLVLKRFKEFDLNVNALDSVKLKSVDVSSKQERGSGQLAFIVPLMMLSFILSGATATALDSTAGEKERGTLESLLVSPVQKSEVVTGKLLATTLVALFSAVCSLLGFITSGFIVQLFINDTNRAITEGMGGQISLSGDALSAMLFIVLSAALIISSALIAISIYARSYKEAQTYISPVGMLIVFPAVGLQFSDFWTVGDMAYIVPLFGSMVALLDIVKGNLNWVHVLLSVSGNLVAMSFLCFLSWRSFSREEVIFRN